MLGPPDLGFPTAGVGVSRPAPGAGGSEDGHQLPPFVTPLPRPAEWVAVRPLELIQIVFPLWFTHVLYGDRYAELAFVQGSIALGSGTRVPTSYPDPPSRSLSLARARFVQRSPFTVFNPLLPGMWTMSKVTRRLWLCSGHPIKIGSAPPPPVSCCLDAPPHCAC